ncbi:hypothetical protein CEXT_327001 [Caerostris extrusa]|uniref:Uncharacterized protein n=1 Tax=Caerostris extrusa TaxID=172846 RepID=A0AAV4SX03_CAEEX|nr:hypothetical protein CEXT_327001 [Caerostris extrusa]
MTTHHECFNLMGFFFISFHLDCRKPVAPDSKLLEIAENMFVVGFLHNKEIVVSRVIGDTFTHEVMSSIPNRWFVYTTRAPMLNTFGGG